MKKTVAITVPEDWASEYFIKKKRNVIYFGKLIISKFYALLIYLSRETFFVTHRYSNFIQYQARTSSFSFPLVVVYRDIRKFGSLGFFSPFKIFFSTSVF